MALATAGRQPHLEGKRTALQPRRSMKRLLPPLPILILAAGVGAALPVGAPSPAPDGGDAVAEKAVIVLAGGCYWGVEAVFEHVAGVRKVVSGFATPDEKPLPGRSAPRYKSPAEAVRIEYDPTKISYEQLLEIFFVIAHDPTQLDRQGPDVGPQYRSALFVADSTEAIRAGKYLDSLQAAAGSRRQITTELVRLRRFRLVDESQQDYVKKNPRAPYVVVNDLPKLQKLERQYPSLFRS